MSRQADVLPLEHWLRPRRPIPSGLEAEVPEGWHPTHGAVPPGWKRAFGGDLRIGEEFVLEESLVDRQGLFAGYGFGGRLFRMTGSSVAESGNLKVWAFGPQPVYVREKRGAVTAGLRAWRFR